MTSLSASALRAGRDLLPSECRSWLGRQRRKYSVWPPLGWTRFGLLRRVTPVSRLFGSDRGTCIDRYYIENFLAQHAADIKGRVLEVADNGYTTRFGAGRVTRSDVLHVQPGNPNATIVADLSSGEGIEPNSFDCIILTQTLQFIYRVQPAVETLRRILKPGGVLLATVPGISQISRYDMDRWGDYWRFTVLSVTRLFAEVFAAAAVHVSSHGNVLAANAMLRGLAAEDLRQEELDYQDSDYQLLITIRAAKTDER
jgi:SAM-dependent methyltransferase